MDQDNASQIDPMSDHRALLEAARQNALRSSATKDLRALIGRLEGACETARVAAIGAMQDSAPRPGSAGESDHNFGFADLFGALRRARAELAGREFGRTEHMPSILPRDARSVSPRAASLGAAMFVRQRESG